MDCQPPQPEEPAPMKEAELMLVQRFRTFDHTFKELVEITDRWERAVLAVRPLTPSEGQGETPEEQAHLHPPSGKKGKKGQDKKDAGKNKEAAAKEAEMQKAAAAAAAEKAAKEVSNHTNSVYSDKVYVKKTIAQANLYF